MIRFIIVFFFLSSCTTHVHLSTRGCSSNNLWWGSEGGENFELKKSLWLSHGDSEVWLRELFKGTPVTCKNVTSLQYEIVKEWDDFLFSLVPFVNKTTFIVKGHYRPNKVKEDSPL